MSNNQFNLKGWAKAAGVRAIKTVAQTAIASIGVNAILNQVDWRYLVSASVLAGVVSLLTSIKGLPELDDNGNVVKTNQDKENGGEEE